jgi:Cu(I)/Ag(I) efflux system membrane fusion protein
MNTITDKIKKNKNASWLLVVLFVGILLGYWLKSDDHTEEAFLEHSESEAGMDASASIPTDHSHTVMTSAAVVSTDNPAEDTLYVCPMMCVPPQENPGDCPICGMELIATPAGQKSGPPRLTLAPETVKLAQIQTAPAERRHVAAEIRLFGQIEYDPVHVSYASVYVPGVIDRVYIKRAGQTVRWGDPLFDIYSPEIFLIEQEMLKALKVVPGYFAFDASKAHVRKRAQVLTDRPAYPEKASAEVKAAYEALEALRLKLILIGMERKDIDELMKKGEPSGIATIYAQRSGTVIEQNAFEGTYVNTGAPMFAIANPKFVWVKLEAYESDYPWIRIGQKAEFVTDTYPGETFMGKVAFIDPIFDTETRTFDVGVVFPDKGRRFRPSMYVRAVIKASLAAGGKVMAQDENLDRAPLVIPDTAPLITGKRSIVYVAVPGEEGVYEGREVILGPRAKNHYVVVDGLQEGEQVVVNGNFKIDSQVQIMAKSSMMSMPGGQPADAHHHRGGTEGPGADDRSGATNRKSSTKMEMKTPMPMPDAPAGMNGDHGHQ